MKLHIENLESKSEYYSKIKKENKNLNEKIKKLSDTKKENEIIILKTENKNLKETIKQKDDEIYSKEQEFNNKISEMKRKIINYEENMKYQNSKIMIESENDNKQVFPLFNYRNFFIIFLV